MDASSSPIHPGHAGTTAAMRRGWAVDRDVIDRWCERGILGLVLLILSFNPLAFGGTGVPQALVTQTLTVGVLLLWVARVWLGKSDRLLWAPVCWAVLAFVTYAVVRYRMVLNVQAVEYLARQEVMLV